MYYLKTVTKCSSKVASEAWDNVQKWMRWRRRRRRRRSSSSSRRRSRRSRRLPCNIVIKGRLPHIETL